MTQDARNRVTLMADGDVGPIIKPVDRYAEWVSDQFPHSLTVEGDEVVVQSPD